MMGWIKDNLLAPIAALKDSVVGLWDDVFGEDKSVDVNAKVSALTAPVVASVPTLENPSQSAGYNASPYDVPAPALVPAKVGLPAQTVAPTNHYSYQYGDIVIQPQPGDSPEDIAREVGRQLDMREREMRQRSRGRLGD